MTIKTISAVRFTANKNNTGYTGEVTITAPDGSKAYPRLTAQGLTKLLKANKDAGGAVHGYRRNVTLKSGGTASIVTYTTDAMQFTGELLGSYITDLTDITAVGTYAGASDIIAHIAGVAVTDAPAKSKTTVDAAGDLVD